MALLHQFLSLCFATAVLAHMQLVYPPPFGAANNPHRTKPADEFLQYPYNCCGRTTPFPCRGYLELLGTPQGAPTASWAAGSEQNWTIAGIGNHYGGSCQVGFSVDRGRTFQVATSYEGNCPHRDAGDGPAGQSFTFKLPADIPPGEVIFAWTWFNREQELNMNCAAVSITAPKKPQEGAEVPVQDPTVSAPAPGREPASTYAAKESTSGTGVSGRPLSERALSHHKRAGGVAISGARRGKTVAFHERPAMLIADDGHGCMTPHTTAGVKYPNPGPDVAAGDGAYPLQLPTPANKCGY